MNRFDSLKGHSYFINNCWLKVELHLRKQWPPCLRERLLKVETIRNGKVFEGGLFLPTLQLKKAETQRGWVSCQGHQVAAGSRIKLIREAYKSSPSTWCCGEKIPTWPDLKVWDFKLLIPALMTQHRWRLLFLLKYILMISYHNHNIMLMMLSVTLIWSSPQPCEVRRTDIIISVLHMRKLSLREVREFAQDHMVN